MNILLNLIPEERKEILKEQVRSKFIFSQALFYLFLEVFYFAILMGAFLVVKYEYDTQLDSIELSTDSDGRRVDEIEQAFKLANEDVSLALRMQSDHFRWTKALLLVQGLVPEGMTLLRVSSKEYQIIVSGKAEKREFLLEFESRLRSQECLRDINVPIANLVSKEDVDFQIDFTIKQECVRQKL